MDEQYSVVPILRSEGIFEIEKGPGNTFKLLNSEIAAAAEASSRPKKTADHS